MRHNRYRFPRRAASCIGALTFVLVAVGSVEAGPALLRASEADPGEVVFYSTQFAPVEDADRIRDEVLADFSGDAEFVPAASDAEFFDRMAAEADAGSGDVSLLGALHGSFVTLESEGQLMDLSDVAAELADAGIPQDFLDLGKLGTDQQYYIPWVQASYVVAAHRDALEYLPEGADVEQLTYDQYLEWAANTSEAVGTPRFGFPAGEEGLMHRFLQGYLVPAFTGGVVTTFEDPAPWEYLAELWPHIHPQSSTYGFMEDPLLSGEVLVAWDHTARLDNALVTNPDDYVVVPAPAGPAGRAHMPVIAGVAIPNTAPNPEGAKALIRHLLDPGVQAMMDSFGFFAVVDTGEAAAPSPGIQLELDAIRLQAESDDALLVLLPIGLADEGGTFNDIYRGAFERVAVNGEDAATAVAEEGARLGEVMATTGAPCWAPDPPSEEACQVGGDS